MSENERPPWPTSEELDKQLTGKAAEIWQRLKNDPGEPPDSTLCTPLRDFLREGIGILKRASSFKDALRSFASETAITTLALEMQAFKGTRPIGEALENRPAAEDEPNQGWALDPDASWQQFTDAELAGVLAALGEKEPECLFQPDCIAGYGMLNSNFRHVEIRLGSELAGKIRDHVGRFISSVTNIQLSDLRAMPIDVQKQIVHNIWRRVQHDDEVLRFRLSEQGQLKYYRPTTFKNNWSCIKLSQFVIDLISRLELDDAKQFWAEIEGFISIIDPSDLYRVSYEIRGLYQKDYELQYWLGEQLRSLILGAGYIVAKARFGEYRSMRQKYILRYGHRYVENRNWTRISPEEGEWVIIHPDQTTCLGPEVSCGVLCPLTRWEKDDFGYIL